MISFGRFMKTLSLHRTSTPSILVTGATGMLGVHFIILGLHKEFKIKGLYRKETSLKKAKHLLELYGKADFFEQVEWIPGDVTDIYSLENALEGVDAVIHAAAKISFNGHARQEMIDINFQGTANMVNAALDAGLDYFLHISSVAALEGKGTVTEEAIWTPSAPHSYYGISKHLAEMEVWRGMEEGLPAGIINPSIVIGPPAVSGTYWNNGFGKTVYDFERGRIPFYTEGVTGYVDVNDVIEIGYRMIEEKVTNERFIVSSENKSFKEILNLLAHYLGHKPPRLKAGPKLLLAYARTANFLAGLTLQPKPYDLEAVKALIDQNFYDNTKIRQRFSYDFTPIERSIEQLVRLYRKQNPK